MSELSYLEKLLDGVKVEWLPLGEITKYEQPTKYLVKAKDYHDTYTIPVLTAGKHLFLDTQMRLMVFIRHQRHL